MKFSYKIIILLTMIYIFNSCTKECLLNLDCNKIKNILNQNWEVYWTIKEYKHDTLKGVYQNQGSYRSEGGYRYYTSPTFPSDSQYYYWVFNCNKDTILYIYDFGRDFFPGIFLDTTVYSLKEISENHMTMTRSRQRIDASDTFDVFINGIFRRN